MKRSGRLGRVRVTADGEGVVSHAGAELLRELSRPQALGAELVQQFILVWLVALEFTIKIRMLSHLNARSTRYPPVLLA